VANARTIMTAATPNLALRHINVMSMLLQLVGRNCDPCHLSVVAPDYPESLLPESDLIALKLRWTFRF
jgi:hypothetical protein